MNADMKPGYCGQERRVEMGTAVHLHQCREAELTVGS